MSETKISIIVPVYNVEKYIKRCLDSLLKQNFEKYEIIVVNDGATDNSMSYVESLQEINDRIKIYNRENGGLSAARNMGMENAHGEYLFFCDSDDALKNNCLDRLYQETVSNQLDMLIFDFEIIPEGDGINQNIADSLGRTEISMEVMTGMQMMRELILKGKYAASACGYLIRRDMILKNGLKFYEGILHEDELFTPVALAYARRVAHRNWVVYDRYVHLGSITTSENIRKRMESMAVVIKELTSFCDKYIEKKWEKEIFEENIINLIREFLGQTVRLKEPGEFLARNKREIRKSVRRKGWSLGFRFEVYIIYVKLKRIMGL